MPLFHSQQRRHDRNLGETEIGEQFALNVSGPTQTEDIASGGLCLNPSAARQPLCSESF